MPSARLRRGTTAHTTASLDIAHPVDATVSRTAHVTASLDIGDPGGA